MDERTFNKHKDCDVVIKYVNWATQSNVPGLYCKEHGTHLRWLPKQLAAELIDSGVDVIKKERLTSRTFFDR